MKSIVRPALGALIVLAAACAATHAPLRIEPPALVAHTAHVSPIDIEHYALDIDLAPQSRSIRATCRVRFHARDAALSEVALDLVGLEVASVVDAAGRALRFTHAAGKLTIQLAQLLVPGDSAEVAIRYSGVPRKGLWFAAEVAGVATQVFTQGECEDARWWFPCIDEPSERATSELRVEMPAGWSSIAAGERVESRELASGRRSDLWRMHTPHASYLTTLVAGHFVEHRSNWDGVPLVATVRPELGEDLEATFAPTGQVLDFLGQLTGVRYPYPKYAQACVDNFPFGGMENISATTLTETCVRDASGRRDADATGLIVHEAAHQWFGDLLTCADWSHIWLNESFATYCTQLYIEATRGRDEFLVAVRDMQESYLGADYGEQRRPHVWNVYREPMDLFFGGQAYPGGASRLHLLRFVLGDEAFFRGVRRYVADNAGRSVVTDDFRAALERESGLDLAPFFAQWFTRDAGYPEFEVRWSWDEANRVARVEVEQVQKPLNGTPSVFSVAVDIEVRDASGRRTTRVMVDERREVFELAAASRPTWVVFDKYGHVPKRGVTTRALGEWLALASEDDDPNGRRDALAALGRALAEGGTQGGTEAERWEIANVVLARLEDPQPSVRVAAARALARVYTPASNPIAQGLMRAASSDSEAGVRVAALTTLADWKENKEFADFAREQYAARFSWATMAGAAALLVAAQDESALPWIVEQLQAESSHTALLSGLLNALSRVPGSAADELMHGCAVDERADATVRSVAVRLLGARKPAGAVRRDFVALLAVTRDYQLQGALIEALSTIGDAQALEALREFYVRSVDSRQKRAIEAALSRSGI